jgi:hypothetical protein
MGGRNRKRRKDGQTGRKGQSSQPPSEDRLTTVMKTSAIVAVSAAWGMVLNDLSDNRAFIVLAILCAVVAGAVVCFRKGDEGSRISRLGPLALLVLAAGAAIAASAATGRWPDLLTASAAILVTGAVLQTACLEKAAQLIGRVAAFGLALTCCKAGALVLAHGNQRVGIAMLLVGAAFAATGCGLATERKALLGAATVILGLAFDGLAIALASQPLRVSAVLAGVGIVIISLGLALLPKRDAASYVGIVAAGIIVAVCGVALLGGRGQAVAGSVVLGLGASFVVVGAACLADRRPIGCAAVVLTGVLIFASAADWHTGRQSLLLAATFTSGITAILFGAAETDHSTLRSWHRWLFKAPSTPLPGTHTKRRP